MKPGKNHVLTINGGSSSIKFALYEVENALKLKVKGEIENIGMEGTNLTFTNDLSNRKHKVSVESNDHTAAIEFLIGWLGKLAGFSLVKAIGHRVVFGMAHTEPEVITAKLLKELKEISGFDPDHLPEEIKLIEVFQRHYPDIVQVACFDTSFHTTMPPVAKLLAIPRRFNAMGIQRYGFHGISYSYLMAQLEQAEGNPMFRGKVVLAHLGNGASLAAVKDGKSIDTSMGFSPAAGIPMGTRTGDLDPGVAWYLMKTENLSPKQFNHLVNHESGLLGVSETSSDMRELIKQQDKDNRAAEAVELFCYQTKKWIGSFAAALNGIETLVFSGGIGENSPEVRERICNGLQFLGIELDREGNFNNGPIISAVASPVCVRVIKTDEVLMIARSVCHILNYNIKN